MMRFCVLLMMLIPMTAAALPEEGNVTRLGIAASTWQETLRLQSQAGVVDVSVANYRGFFLSAERQKRMKGGGYALAAAVGAGSASGGTGESIDYQRGSISWAVIQLQPRVIWALTDQVDLALSLAGTYRAVSWPESDLVKVTPSRQLGAILLFDFDCMLTEKLAFRQSIGSGNLEAGPFMRWGLSYDL